MENTINGIHHITAIAGDALKNYDFYTRVLGLRLVKKTVNFDDPQTYHLYYGDKHGTPGTALTFFPWSNVMQGRRGTRQVTEIGYSVNEASFGFWLNRFEKENVIYNKVSEKFGIPYLTFLDPDGLKFELIANGQNDNREPWSTRDVSAEVATKGFYNVTLSVDQIEPTANVLTSIFGYKLQTQEVNRFRFSTDAIETANVVDIVELPAEKFGHVAGGSVHHVAFRVKDEETLMAYRNLIADKGFHITEKIDRNYFYSLYFREPGGVLFELATDNPGFTVDETEEELGSNLMLPAQFERYRNTLENSLPVLI